MRAKCIKRINKVMTAFLQNHFMTKSAVGALLRKRVITMYYIFSNYNDQSYKL